VREILQIWADRGELSKFISSFFDELQEEDLLRIYLSRPFRKNYADWRKEVMGEDG
jgi:hypothetical protein